MQAERPQPLARAVVISLLLLRVMMSPLLLCSLEVTIKSHQTYMNLTDAFFKQTVCSIFKQCCEKGTRERCRRPREAIEAATAPAVGLNAVVE